MLRREDIIILKGDKGNTLVVMKKEEYDQKMREHIACGSYRKVNKDPMKKITKLVTTTIRNSSLDDHLKQKLIPKISIIPWIYVSPKIHKQGGPIVNTIRSPTYNLEK